MSTATIAPPPDPRRLQAASDLVQLHNALAQIAEDVEHMRTTGALALVTDTPAMRSMRQLATRLVELVGEPKKPK